MKANWKRLDVYKGITIFERVGVGRGGRFKAAGTCRMTLEQIKAWIDTLETENLLERHK